MEFICGSSDQRKQRVLLTRSRLFSETKIYLNNSNSKWVSVGVTPSSREKAGPIKNFYTELYIGGINCQSLSLGGITGFKKFVRQLREIGYWRHMFLEVSIIKNADIYSMTGLIYFFLFFQQKSVYSVEECINGFIIERINNYAQPVFKVTKIDDDKSMVYMAMQTIESILQSEKMIIDLAERKFPLSVFNNYLTVLAHSAANRQYDMAKDQRIRTYNFPEECLCNFRDLFEYDLNQILSEREIIG